MPRSTGFGRIAALSAAALLALSGPAAAQPSASAHELAARLGAAMERCWFMGGDRDFGAYVYSPEPNATGGPRILVVPRDAPDGRPVLVIEISEMGGRPHINVYGPLATGPVQARIAEDLRRWLDGGEACS